MRDRSKGVAGGTGDDGCNGKRKDWKNRESVIPNEQKKRPAGEVDSTKSVVEVRRDDARKAAKGTGVVSWPTCSIGCHDTEKRRRMAREKY